MQEWSYLIDSNLDKILNVVREAYESSLNEFVVGPTHQRVLLEKSGRCWYGTFPIGQQTTVEQDGVAVCIAALPDVFVTDKASEFDVTVERVIRETHLRLLAGSFDSAS